MTDTPRKPRAAYAKATDLAALAEAQAAQAEELARQRSEIERLKSVMDDSHDKLSELHRVLMGKAPGHDKSLVERFAAITLWAESVSRLGYGLKWVAGVIVAVGILVAALRIGPIDAGNNQ